ncbi:MULTISPECIES: hypothetical protein [unclassified Sedimentibacter]|uniref:hypothetical protein n=1 Tax=unclassified Sedimentibacter TaxID=2649220 RepID=UPI0027E00D1C|nr:hypothetical protein [Sedimentibacter sp. MB35-C1]WMJ77678.1 hypothetical protein RBQ61_01765 [Sedimentibacter sp. MB35-C1]
MIINITLELKKHIFISAVIIFVLANSILLAGCSNVESNSDLEYYKSENEELKLKITELKESIKNYNSNKNMLNNNLEETNIEISKILHVKEIGEIYYIVLMFNSNDVNDVQLW